VKKHLITKFNAPKIAIATALLLALVKGSVGFISGSVAIISSAFDSVLDMITSCINLFMIKAADTPPDSDHQFGHGKLEAYSSLIQSIIIFITGMILLYMAFKKLLTPHVVEVTAVSALVMLAAIIVSAFLNILLKRVAERESSQALKADAMHYAIDIASNSCVLLTVLVIKLTGAAWLDPLIGGILAIYIIYSATQLHIAALNIMLDSRLPKDKLRQIYRNFRLFEPYHQSIHRLRTRTDGAKVFADVHVTLCKDLTLADVHTLIDIIENKFELETSIDLMVHPEPCDGSCEGTDSCKKNAILSLLHGKGNNDESCSYKEVMSILHGEKS
jgi:cation diffusion facilitator family transporter